MARTQNAQLDSAAWISAASKLLAKSGIDAVRVEPLAKSLGVTKGSFYYHFKDRPALHAAILSAWRQRATNLVIDRLNSANLEPKQRLSDLLQLPRLGERSAQGANVELAVRQWASRDSLAADAVKEVDNHRLSYITAVYKQMGLGDKDAQSRAFVLYSALLGQAFIQAPEKESLMTQAEAFLLDVPRDG